jgi:Zn-dependent protease
VSALLLVLNALKLGKVAVTVATMLLSIAAYAWLFGWWYAAGFVALLFAHEMGHYIAARQRGLDVGMPTFVPFIGASVQLRELPHDAETEAYVGVAGPLAGTLGALGCYYVGRGTHSTLFLALAYSGFLVNLFNLIPLAPLDGARVTAAISPKLWLVGVPVVLALSFYRWSPLLILLAVLGVPSVLKAWRILRGQESPEEQAYRALPLETRLCYGALYLGMAIFLALMCQQLHAELPPGNQF